MFSYFGLKERVATIAGISTGSYLTFKMLKRKELFPGLPFSEYYGYAQSGETHKQHLKSLDEKLK